MLADALFAMNHWWKNVRQNNYTDYYTIILLIWNSITWVVWESCIDSTLTLTVRFSLCQQSRRAAARHNVLFRVLQTVQLQESDKHLAWRWEANLTCWPANMMPQYSTVTDTDNTSIIIITIITCLTLNSYSIYNSKKTDDEQLTTRPAAVSIACYTMWQNSQ